MMRAAKDILLCLEGSPGTEAATRLAIEIARECGASLDGLAIVDEPDIRAGQAVGIGGSSFKHDRDEVLMADARAKATEWLALFESRCRAAGVEGRPMEIVGRPSDAILEEMETRFLTVLGRDSNFRFETESEDPETRDKILRHASQPVLLVPETAKPSLGSTVLIAYDGSGASKRAIGSFIDSGLARSRKIHVVTIDDNGAVAWEMANRAVQLLRASNLEATPHNVVSLLSNTEVLTRLSNEVDAGVIVMGAFTRSRLREMFKGSVTRSLVETTTVPLYMQH